MADTQTEPDISYLASVTRVRAAAGVILRDQAGRVLDAPGMDPTWLLHLAGQLIEAEVVLFYGPYVDISVLRSAGAEDELYIGGERDITACRLVDMLDDLVAVDRGAELPSWLRPAPDALLH
ncbi:hypothetical protein [Micromonospora sp. KC723]|uniref:hypothetical protein n=1 Tax=Micromonospora sp. KC723 TaxID=2530381 RepID=UPI00104DE5E8|nr:hypothetical protein [Micromonospora sp. KC723]TDB74329.1 hypothetical protein E1165_14725 [Micromonospora sp. KC723]